MDNDKAPAKGRRRRRKRPGGASRDFNARRRRELGLTLEDMCAKCHIGKDQAHKIDYGDTDKMRVRTLKKVARVLRCPWTKLAD
jgi:transcriptional regulator with XRE-family HTH domain